jgi:ASPM-SPD-2-Hydin domain-containing protein
MHRAPVRLRRAAPAFLAAVGLLLGGGSQAVLASPPSAQWNPSGHNFGNQAVNTTSTGFVMTLSVITGQHVTLSADPAIVESDNATPQFAIVAGPQTTCANGLTIGGSSPSCTVEVDFDPTAIGNWTATLSQASNGPGSPYNATLSGNSVGVTATATPSSHDFGNVVQGQPSAHQEFDLTNTSSTGVSIFVSSVAFTGTNAADFALSSDGCTNQNVASNASCAVMVTFTPSIIGAESATLAFTDDAGTQDVSLSGTGVAPPTIDLVPSSVDFGNVTVGSTSAPHQVVLSNPSANVVAAHVSSVALSGANAADFAITGDYCSNNDIGPGGSCLVTVTFTPSLAAPESASLDFTDDAASSPQSAALTGHGTTNSYFYFAEGSTRPGFHEQLSLFIPNHAGGGTATIQYFVGGAAIAPKDVTVPENTVVMEDVNSDLTALGYGGQDVSAQVTFTAVNGVAERLMHFASPAQWHGSTDVVGASAPNTDWYLAEGSTLSSFNEYVTLQNANGTPANVTLTWQTDVQGTATKTLQLPANSRTTVFAFNGSVADTADCSPTTTCGVGAGVAGVSLHVQSDQPVVVERPFYVNGNNWGSGAISDGHVGFGSNTPGSTWYFAEGSTFHGFNEFLTIQNPNASATTATITYYTDINGASPFTREVDLPANSRTTVFVYTGSTSQQDVNHCVAGATCGIGPNVSGVSAKVTAPMPVVVERPMYMVNTFPGTTSPVAGATVVAGATTLGQSFGFSALTTAPGEDDFLTIQNPGATDSNVEIDYFNNGVKTVENVTVKAGTRFTVWTFGGTAGAYPVRQNNQLGLAVTSDQPVLVEKPTFSTNGGTYGATDTQGAQSTFS